MSASRSEAGGARGHPLHRQYRLSNRSGLGSELPALDLEDEELRRLDVAVRLELDRLRDAHVAAETVDEREHLGAVGVPRVDALQVDVRHVKGLGRVRA